MKPKYTWPKGDNPPAKVTSAQTAEHLFQCTHLAKPAECISENQTFYYLSGGEPGTGE
jgi:hypothetical protein